MVLEIPIVMSEKQIPNPQQLNQQLLTAMLSLQPHVSSALVLLLD